MKEDMACSCEKCVECCTRTPGWFAPGEAEKAAKHMNLTMEAFINKYLVRDYWCGDLTDKDHGDEGFSGDVYVWAPRKDGQKFYPGDPKTATWGSAFDHGRCVFLDENDRCKIHAVKPKECRLSFGCDSKRDQASKGEPGHRQEIAKEWLAAGNPLAEEVES